MNSIGHSFVQNVVCYAWAYYAVFTGRHTRPGYIRDLGVCVRGKLSRSQGYRVLGLAWFVRRMFSMIKNFIHALSMFTLVS
jgi:hypothetical protein